jgi:hypothetical protein
MSVKISLTASVYTDEYGSAAIAKADESRQVPEMLDVSAAPSKLTSAQVDELREHVAGAVKRLGKELDRQLEVASERAVELERRVKKDERDAQRAEQGAGDVPAF